MKRKQVILTGPHDENSFGEIDRTYRRAFSKATELTIATAFLTAWPYAPSSLPLNGRCTEFMFLVGTDFGLTRKAAIRSVRKWTPARLRAKIYAVDLNKGWSFHPKLLLWKERTGHCYGLVGSSNLTRAALSRNVEANAEVRLSAEHYDELKGRLAELRDQSSSPIEPDWFKTYEEAKLKASAGSKKKGKPGPLAAGKIFALPQFDQQAMRERLIDRRYQKDEFLKVKSRLQRLVERCATGQISGREFYPRLLKLWSTSRFQAPGFERQGKGANWREVCGALLAVVRKQLPVDDSDRRVADAIDLLKQKRNSLRGAWFSEMLCQFQPDRYPVLNNPVKEWLRQQGVRRGRGVSDGQYYIEIARRLRVAVAQSKAKNQSVSARDLAEADLLIRAVIG